MAFWVKSSSLTAIKEDRGERKESEKSMIIGLLSTGAEYW